MERFLAWLFVVFLLSSCQNDVSKRDRSGADLSAEEVGDYIASPKFQLFHLSMKDGDTGVILSGTLTLDLSCDNVFATGATADWAMQSVSASSSVSLVQNKACSIAVQQYFDGTNTFTPVNVNAPLTISVATDGAVAQTSPVQYTTGGGTPILQWYAAAQGVSLYTIVMSFTSETVSGNSSVTPTNLASQAVPLSISGITAPTVSSLFVYDIPAINSVAESYTLVASVSNATSCKYIDNSSATYTPTSWSSVNTAYNAGGAQACPVFVPGQLNFSQGNWTSLWSTGVKTLIIWANTVNGLNAYTTANIGP